MLKAILYDVNPLYVLEEPDFKNSAGLEYSSLIKDKSELCTKPNGNVIAFHSSVLRSLTFSKTAFENKNTLMKLKNARDIIVHNNFKLLDVDELKLLLKRDLYPLISAFSNEYNLGGQTNFFNNLHSRLATISSSLQGDIEKQIKLKIEGANSYWITLKGNSTFNIKAIEQKTFDLINNEFHFPAECPSCKNIGIVYTSPLMSYDRNKSELIQTGLDTKAFKCCFCNLEVANYKELDSLKITPNINGKAEIINHLSENLFDELN